MLPKSARFERISFPTGRPDRRINYAWGVVSLYASVKPKVAVVISKKTLKKAHDRNHLRRRLYGALDGVELKASTVIFPRREALTTSFKTLTNDLAKM